MLKAYLRSITKSPEEVLIKLKPGDTFEDGDLKYAYKILGEKDKRALQTLALRKLEGLAINTRAMNDAQLLRTVEVLVEALAQVRSKRLES